MMNLQIRNGNCILNSYKSVALHGLILFIMIQQVYAVDISCGNNVCNVNENYYSCPNDCKSGEKDNFCDQVMDSVCDPDCEQNDPDCRQSEKEIKLGVLHEKKNKSNNIVWLLGYIMLIFVIIYFVKKRLDSKNKSDAIDETNYQEQAFRPDYQGDTQPFENSDIEPIISNNYRS